MFTLRPFQRGDALNLKDFSPSFRLVFGTFNIWAAGSHSAHTLKEEKQLECLDLTWIYYVSLNIRNVDLCHLQKL